MRIDKIPSYHPRGPFPRGDPVGMSLAVDMLLKSLVAKRRIFDHVQFAMLRKMRSTYTKNWESSPARRIRQWKVSSKADHLSCAIGMVLQLSARAGIQNGLSVRPKSWFAYRGRLCTC
jgi:hypothetical protein